MKVSYKGKFPTGSFLNEDIGFEDDIRENETPLEAVRRLRNEATEAHKDKYPEFYQSNGNQYPNTDQTIKVVQKEKDNREETIRQLIEEIQSCKTTKQLDIYKYLLKQYPETQSEYDKRLQIIQNQPS